MYTNTRTAVHYANGSFIGTRHYDRELTDWRTEELNMDWPH